MKKSILLLIFLFVVSGIMCVLVSAGYIGWGHLGDGNGAGNSTQLQTDIHYIKDTRTGLCFAKRALWCTDYSLSDNYSFAQVPCSAEVEGLIGK